MLDTLMITSNLFLWVLVVLEGTALAWLIQAYAAGRLGDTDQRSAQGPPVGARTPKVHGKPVRSVGDPSSATSTLVVFMSAACAPCFRARAFISDFASTFAPAISTQVVCAGEFADVEDFAAGLDSWVEVLADPENLTGLNWNIDITPFAVALDRNDIVIAKTAKVLPYELHALGLGVRNLVKARRSFETTPMAVRS